MGEGGKAGGPDGGGLGRREVLGLIAGGAAATAAGRVLAAPDREPGGRGARRMPAIFLAHGSPMLLDDAAWMAELKAWADALPRPRAILVLSAHWEERPLALGATKTVPLVYDFHGFPDKYYRYSYPAPGAPELAQRVRALAGAAQPVADEPARGLDHGAWVPLLAMYPRADVPVLQVSLPGLEPRALLDLGRALAPLRDEGVLLVGSGFLTHNLRLARWGEGAATPAWAQEFDAWSAEALSRRDVDTLLDYRRKAPGVALALPTHEHFVPVLAALGAATEAGPVRFPVTGFLAASLTRRSVQFG